MGKYLAGVDLSRKIGFNEGEKTNPLFGWTCPLLIKADGEKWENGDWYFMGIKR